MKLLKLSLIAILMSLVIMSCGSDNTIDPDGEPVTPESTTTITTTVNNEEVDKRVIVGKDGDFTPDTYVIAGFYVNVNGLFSMSITGDTDENNDFRVNFGSKLTELKAGTYTFSEEDEIFNNASYFNIDLGTEQYLASNATLVLTKVQYIGITEQVGNYYITGTLNMELENETNVNPNVSVKVDFKDMEILKAISGF